MTVARQVLDPRGARVLVQQGAVLTPEVIARLVERGVTDVVIAAGGRSHGAEGQPAPGEPRVGGLLSQGALTQAVQRCRSVLDGVEARAELDAGEAAAVVEGLLDEILLNLDVVTAVTMMKQADDYTYRHAVGTCLVVLTVGCRMQFDRFTLRDLGLAALLMDIGMLRVPREIRRKPGRLSPREYELVQQHVEWSYQLLRNTRGVRPLVAQLAYQHHERWDGTGYTRGLDGHAIHPHAQFIALADVYDAMTSDRPHARAQAPFPAAEQLLALRGRWFEPELCRRFVTHVLNYGPGVTVELSDGTRATVEARDPAAPTRPLVRRPGGELLDLAARRDLQVLRLAGDRLACSAS